MRRVFYSLFLLLLEIPLFGTNSTGKEIFSLPNHREPLSQETRYKVPLSLLLDLSQPISQGEDLLVHEKLIENVVSREDNIHYFDLPEEVQKVIQIMTGERYATAYFYLVITVTHDHHQPTRGVKTYTYTPVIFDKELEVMTLANSRWIFKRQEGTLRLETCDVDDEPLTN